MGASLKARAEAFGAWIRLDEPPSLIAVDRALATRLGVDGGAAWAEGASTEPRAPLEAHVAVTSRCAAGCRGCYLDAKPDGLAPDFDVIAGRLAALAEAGVFTVAFGGGEPMSRPDVHLLAAHAKRLGLSPVMTTSGLGMTPKRAEELRAFDQINVSYDGQGEDYQAVRGWDGARVAERAMRLLREAGVSFGVNMVLTRQSFDGAERAIERAASLGAIEVQLLRFKPAGRATGLAYLDARLTQAQIAQLYPMLDRLVAKGQISVRIDCAMVPFLAAHVADGALLARLGIFGCEAAHHLAAITIDGAISPCSFSPPSTATLARAQDVEAAWVSDGELSAIRNHSLSPPEPCRSCSLRSACRGGCRVVAAHAGDASAPDPECPRVIALTSERVRTQDPQRSHAGIS